MGWANPRVAPIPCLPSRQFPLRNDVSACVENLPLSPLSLSFWLTVLTVFVGSYKSSLFSRSSCLFHRINDGRWSLRWSSLRNTQWSWQIRGTSTASVAQTLQNALSFDAEMFSALFTSMHVSARYIKFLYCFNEVYWAELGLTFTG